MISRNTYSLWIISSKPMIYCVLRLFTKNGVQLCMNMWYTLQYYVSLMDVIITFSSFLICIDIQMKILIC